MKLLQGLILVAVAVPGWSLTCYRSEEGGDEAQCDVAGPELQDAVLSKDLAHVKGLCFTFQSVEGSGASEVRNVTRGCSAGNKQSTCEDLKDTLLLGTRARRAVTSCDVCHHDLCNFDPTEAVAWAQRDARQFNPSNKAGRRPNPVVPTPANTPAPTTTPSALTTKNEFETEEPEDKVSLPEEEGEGRNDEIAGRQASWGQSANANRNPFGRLTTTPRYPGRNVENTTPRDEENSQEEYDRNGQGGRPNYGQQQRPGNNNFGQGANNGRPGQNNFGQQGQNNFGQPNNGQNNFGQPNNGQNFGQQGQNNFGQPNNGHNNFGQPNNGQNFGQTQRPGGYGGNERESGFGQGGVGRQPDGSWSTGVQYVTKYPGEGVQRSTEGPHGGRGQGAVQPPKWEMKGPQYPAQGGYKSKEREGPPVQASASALSQAGVVAVTMLALSVRV